ncbi:MAG: 16S rRNA (adenine(1518)-N(6)/adenine(1519)-N(6))-dimethyltransferase RsmA [Rickettsiales bacterium]
MKLSIREVIKKYNLEPNKKLGQNFLFDPSITDQIVSLCGDLSHSNVLEVGPGPGLLTRSIISSKPHSFIAIEADERCVLALAELEGVKVIHGDALRFVENDIEGKVTVIANLPYNIGTELIFKWLENLSKFEFFVLMLQKEVVERICAEPNTKKYGKLSVMLQSVCEVETLFDIDPEFFYPPPKVISTVVRIIPKKDTQVNLRKLSKLCTLAFNQRRKMIKTTLSSLKLPESVDQSQRAENLTVAEFLAIMAIN